MSRIVEVRSALTDAQAARDAEVAQEVASKLTVALLTNQERRSIIAARVRRPGITDSALARLLHLDARLSGELDQYEMTGVDGMPLPSAVPEIIINYLPPHMAKPRIPPSALTARRA